MRQMRWPGPTARFVMVVALGGLVSNPLVAQQGVADAGARLGWVSLTGDDFAAAKDALGFEAFLRWSFPSGIGIQGGAHYSSHEIEGASDKLGLLNVYLEPLYVFPVSIGVRGAAPFIGVRGLYGRFESITGEADVNADGWGLGGVAGIIVPITRQVGIELSALYTALSTGTAKFNDLQIPNSGLNGGLLAFQVALFASTGH